MSLAIALSGLALLAILHGLWPAWLDELETRSIDYRYRLRLVLGPAPAGDGPVFPVDMDDDAVTSLGRLPWPRSRHAEVIRRLSGAGAAGVAFDLFFSRPSSPAEDATLVDACRASGRVIVGIPVRLAADRSAVAPVPFPAEMERFLARAPFPPGTRPFTVSECMAALPGLAPALGGAGHIAGEPDSDSVFRRFPILVSVNGRPLPSLGLVMACLALGVDPGAIRPGPGLVVIPTPGGEVRVPVDDRMRVWLNYTGRHEPAGQKGYLDALRMEPGGEVAGGVRGRVCLVAPTYTGGDPGATPIQTNVPRSVIHSTTAVSILSGRHLRSAPAWTSWALLVALTLLLPWLAGRLEPAPFAVVAAALAVGSLAVAVCLFAFSGLVVRATDPFILTVWTAVGTIQYRLGQETRRRRELVHTFARYFSPGVMKKLLADPGAFSMRPQRRDVTILFSDIRGFTTLSETLDPDVVQVLLCEYFDRMTEIVFRHGGTVDKFMGDGMLAFFDDPETFDDHALRAVNAAVEMQRAVRDLSASWKASGRPSIEIRVGVNTGRVAVGNLGATQRVEYSVIGHAVNMAQRFEAAAPPGGVLIGDGTRDAVKDRISIRATREIRVKGIDHDVRVHEVRIDEPAAPVPDRIIGPCPGY
ncbi:MAG: adenylate/guanylate cyclase domain-containing protein [Candidatus Riflebacteria bacterium]|nr:adenylate/guanylate cyclase domain-containing protein [Candidatus Riflebacteria bacterium]